MIQFSFHFDKKSTLTLFNCALYFIKFLYFQQRCRAVHITEDMEVVPLNCQGQNTLSLLSEAEVVNILIRFNSSLKTLAQVSLLGLKNEEEMEDTLLSSLPPKVNGLTRSLLEQEDMLMDWSCKLTWESKVVCQEGAVDIPTSLALRVR